MNDVKEKATEFLKIRPTPKEKETFKLLANSSPGGTMSSWVKEQLQDATKKKLGRVATRF